MCISFGSLEIKPGITFYLWILVSIKRVAIFTCILSLFSYISLLTALLNDRSCFDYIREMFYHGLKLALSLFFLWIVGLLIFGSQKRPILKLFERQAAVSISNIENNTSVYVDREFLSECLTWYLTSELSKRVRYKV